MHRPLLEVNELLNDHVMLSSQQACHFCSLLLHEITCLIEQERFHFSDLPVESDLDLVDFLLQGMLHILV